MLQVQVANIHSTQQSRLIQTLIVIHNLCSRFRYLYSKVHSAQQSYLIQTLIVTLMHFPGTGTVDTHVHKSKLKIHPPQQSRLIQTLIVIHNVFSRFRYLYLKVHSAEQSCPIQTLIVTLSQN